MDIIITLPKSVKWVEYEKELEAVKSGEYVLNFKVNYLPKVEVGDRCYIVYDGFIRGYMHISGKSYKEFVCSTTGKRWNGNFIERTGEFYEVELVPMKGFQGFRYYKDEIKK